MNSFSICTKQSPFYKRVCRFIFFYVWVAVCRFIDRANYSVEGLRRGQKCSSLFSGCSGDGCTGGHRDHAKPYRHPFTNSCTLRLCVWSVAGVSQEAMAPPQRRVLVGHLNTIAQNSWGVCVCVCVSQVVKLCMLRGANYWASSSMHGYVQWKGWEKLWLWFCMPDHAHSHQPMLPPHTSTSMGHSWPSAHFGLSINIMNLLDDFIEQHHLYCESLNW